MFGDGLGDDVGLDRGLQGWDGAAGAVGEGQAQQVAGFDGDGRVERQRHVVVQPVDRRCLLLHDGQDVFRHEAHGVQGARLFDQDRAFPGDQAVDRLAKVDDAVDGGLRQLDRAWLHNAGFLELHDRGVEAVEVVFLLEWLDGHDHGFRHEQRQRAAEFGEVAALV